MRTFIHGMMLVLFFATSAHAWTIDHVIGSVTIESPGKPAEPAHSGQVLNEGDVVVTGEGAIALLTDEKSEIYVAGQSRFSLDQAPPANHVKPGLLHLLQGKVRAKLKRNPDQAFYPYEIQAKTVVAGVRGTEFFVVNEGPEVHIATLEGVVSVRLKDRPDDKPVAIRAGESLTHRESDQTLAKPHRHESKQIRQWQKEVKEVRERPERDRAQRERSRRR